MSSGAFPRREEASEAIRKAVSNGAFDDWKRRYFELIEREGMIQHYKAVVKTSIEKSSFLPSDPYAPLPLQRRQQKFAEISNFIEKQAILSDCNIRAMEITRTNSELRNLIKRDLERMASSSSSTSSQYNPYPSNYNNGGIRDYGNNPRDSNNNREYGNTGGNREYNLKRSRDDSFHDDRGAKRFRDEYHY